MGCGSLIFILCSVLLVLTSFDAGPELAIVYKFVALLQIALVASSVTTYYSMTRESEEL